MPSSRIAIKTKKRVPFVLGWKETVDLPDWGVREIVAKADTGARRSAIDVQAIRELPGGQEVEFEVVASRRRKPLITQTVRAKIDHVTHVRSSNGTVSERYFVRTRVRIGPVEKVAELSLVCRRHMVCRVLLGRTLLGKDFLIDSSARYLAGPRKKPKILNQESLPP